MRRVTQFLLVGATAITVFACGSGSNATGPDLGTGSTKSSGPEQPVAVAQSPLPGRWTAADGVVTDSEMGLEWQQSVDSKSYTFDDATKFCTGLSLGTGSWRLPTKDELVSIVDSTMMDPAVVDRDGTFAKTPSEPFWTSTVYSEGTTTKEIWRVDFNSGHPNTDGSTHALRVRCARSMK